MTGKTFQAACIQLNAGADPKENFAAAAGLIREARARGADFIATPEVTNMLEPNRKALHEKVRLMDEDESLKGFRDLAAETGAWLLIGSMVFRKADDDRLANRSVLIDPAGEVVTWYDKIHMFDVNLENGETHRESSAYAPGAAARVADLPWGRVGLSICYDVRFPYLYRSLAKAGADFITTPAAFTRTTGEAHWHVLQRARAIENGCFVIAPAQCGTHADGRKTFGHSLIVDPWGEVLAEGGAEPGIVMAEIDPAKVAVARGKIPALTHDRDFAAPGAPERASAAE